MHGMNFISVKDELQYVENKIAELNKHRKELIEKDEERFLEDAKKYIGRCFRINNRTYAKVLDVPVKDWQFGLNKYQFPALFVYPKIDDVPFEYDTLFSGAWGEGHNLNKTKYEEISQKEFDTIFMQTLEDFKERVLNNRSL